MSRPLPFAPPSPGVQVVMRRSEMLHAYLVGTTRQVDNIFNPLVKARYGASVEAALEKNLHGAMGEKVVAKHFGLYWSGEVGDYGAKDVGGAQVRAAPNVNGSLIVHDEDLDGDPFILVCGTGPRFWIPGWIMGAAAKDRARYWRERKRDGSPLQCPAYFVPQADLQSIGTLQLPWDPRRAA